MKAVCICLTQSDRFNEDQNIHTLQEIMPRILGEAGYSPEDFEIRVKDIPGLGDTANGTQ